MSISYFRRMAADEPAALCGACKRYEDDAAAMVVAERRFRLACPTGLSRINATGQLRRDL
jgi:hypothetical protein